MGEVLSVSKDVREGGSCSSGCARVEGPQGEVEQTVSGSFSIAGGPSLQPRQCAEDAIFGSSLLSLSFAVSLCATTRRNGKWVLGVRRKVIQGIVAAISAWSPSISAMGPSDAIN